MITKDQALEIRNAALAECPMDTPPEYSRGYDSGALALFEALASAGAFTDGAGDWTDEDQPLPEDEAIDAAHPVRTGNHAIYAEAMRMVGAKRSKGALVELVNWLLVLVHDLGAKAVLASEPSRPVATEAGAKALELAEYWYSRVVHDDDGEDALINAMAEDLEEAIAESSPVATGSKARAEEILNAETSALTRTGLISPKQAIVALDRAGFFADESTLAEIEALRLLLEWRAGNPERCFEVRCLESGETRDPWAVRLERESVGWSHEEVAFDDLLRGVQFALRRAAAEGEA